MSRYAPANSKNIVQLDGSKNEAGASDLDRSGQAIVSLLQEAAGAVRANEERAMGMARKLSDGLKASEDRAAQLEAEVRHYQDRAFRAEEWLLRVYKEIEDKFFNQDPSKNRQQSARQ